MFEHISDWVLGYKHSSEFVIRLAFIAYTGYNNY